MSIEGIIHDAPKDRAYDPIRRPGVYYKGDPASEQALMESALQARATERKHENALYRLRDQKFSGEDLKHAEVLHNANMALGLTPPEWGGGSNYPEQDLSVAEAQHLAAQGRPVSGDASIERFRPGGSNDTLDEINDARDEARDSKD